MILFDLMSLQPQSSAFKHGGGTYATLVLKRMLERKIPFAAFYDSRRYIDKELYDSMISNNIQIYDTAAEKFEEIVGKIEKPVVFSVLPKQYMLITKTIGNIHDCRELELPNDFWELYYGYNYKTLFRKLFRVFFEKKYVERQKKKMSSLLYDKNFVAITDTFYSKYKLNTYFSDANLRSMKVFYSPISLELEGIGITMKEKYFLLVSGNRWLKNNLRAIVAFDNLFEKGYLEGYKVVITGVKSFKQFKKRIKNINRFEILDYVDDKKLQQLYEKAFCFLFPSLNEGFGIPPLEAMRYGTPVIATNLSSVPEVCGDAAVYIDPFSIDDIMSKILMLTYEQSIYLEIQNRSVFHYRELIEKTISDTDNYIDYVISES